MFVTNAAANYLSYLVIRQTTLIQDQRMCKHRSDVYPDMYDR